MTVELPCALNNLGQLAAEGGVMFQHHQMVLMVSSCLLSWFMFHVHLFKAATELDWLERHFVQQASKVAEGRIQDLRSRGECFSLFDAILVCAVPDRALQGTVPCVHPWSLAS